MSGVFKKGAILMIYGEKGNPEYWEDWMNLFLKEGNLLWKIDYASPVRVSSVNNNISNQYLEVRLTNPENLNAEVFKYLKNENHQINKKDPIKSSGWLLYHDDVIYYHPPDYQDFIGQFDKILLEAPRGNPKWKVEEHEQTEVNRIIKTLKGLWGDKYMSDFFEDQTNKELVNYTKANGRTWEDFLRRAWQEEVIQNLFLAHHNPGDYVYDKIEKYVKENSATAVQAQAVVMGDALVADPVETMKDGERRDAWIAMAGYGGGRKKRRKRSKTKRNKSKTKKTRRRKTRKRRNFNKKYYRKKNNQCTKKRKTNKKKKLFGGADGAAGPEPAVDNNLIIKTDDLFRGTDGYAMAKSFLFDEKRLTGGPEVGKITGESCGRDSNGVSVWYIDDSPKFRDPKRVFTLLFEYSEKSADHFERISSLEDILSKIKEDQPDRENISLESVEQDYLTYLTACRVADWKLNRQTRKTVLADHTEINERNKKLWEYIQKIGIGKFSDLFRLSKIPILLKVRQIGDDDGTTGSFNRLRGEKRFEAVEIIESYTNEPIPDDLMVILDKYELPHPNYITSITKV